LQVFGIVLLTLVATVGIGYGWLSHYVFPDNFESVTLDTCEQDSLNTKLNSLGIKSQSAESGNLLQPVWSISRSRTGNYSSSSRNGPEL